ncbi:MAG: aromatic ring-hydroxylating dioxygenase subunit alpha [Pseudomonadota bacterium]
MNHSPTEPRKALAARYYTDPDVYALEKNTVLASTWQFAAHESELTKPGDYVSFTVAGQALFCVRGKDNQINTFYNVCQHRAHELVNGNGNARLLVCPYHAWTYELSGELRAGPNINVTPGFDKSQICLTSVRTEIFLGFVFVNLDENARPMDEWFPGVRDELSAYVPHLDQLKLQQWVSVAEDCNWKVSIENYSECYHCERNHPTFSKGVVKPSTYDIQPQGHCLRHTTECQNLDSMTYPIDLDGHAKAGNYSSWFLWPMFSFQVYPGNVLNTYHWRDLGEARVDVIRGWYEGGHIDPDVARQLAIQDRDTTVAEDIRLVESVQRGLNSRGYRPGPLVLDPAGGVRSEHSIRALHDWYQQGLPADS